MVRSFLSRWSRVLVLALFVVATSLASVGCGAVGSRDPQDLASDFEGSIDSSMVDRLLRQVDLTQANLEVRAGRSLNERFGPEDQPRLETLLRESAEALAGGTLRSTQRVVEELGRDAVRVTLTLEFQREGVTRYVPVELEAQRSGRRLVLTRVRVMAELR